MALGVRLLTGTQLVCGAASSRRTTRVLGSGHRRGRLGCRCLGGFGGGRLGPGLAGLQLLGGATSGVGLARRRCGGGRGRGRRFRRLGLGGDGGLSGRGLGGQARLHLLSGAPGGGAGGSVTLGRRRGCDRGRRHRGVLGGRCRGLGPTVTGLQAVGTGAASVSPATRGLGGLGLGLLGGFRLLGRRRLGLPGCCGLGCGGGGRIGAVLGAGVLVLAGSAVGQATGTAGTVALAGGLAAGRLAHAGLVDLGVVLVVVLGVALAVGGDDLAQRGGGGAAGLLGLAALGVVVLVIDALGAAGVALAASLTVALAPTTAATLAAALALLVVFSSARGGGHGGVGVAHGLDAQLVAGLIAGALGQIFVCGADVGGGQLVGRHEAHDARRLEGQIVVLRDHGGGGLGSGSGLGAATLAAFVAAITALRLLDLVGGALGGPLGVAVVAALAGPLGAAGTLVTAIALVAVVGGGRLAAYTLLTTGSEDLEGVAGAHGGGIGEDLHLHIELVFEVGDLGALLVEQEQGDGGGQSAADAGAVGRTHRQLLQAPQHGHARHLGAHHPTGAVAHGALLVRARQQTGLDALARELEQPEARETTHLGAGLVAAQRGLELPLDGAAVLGVDHVDEVDHHQPAEVAQPELARDGVCGLAVGLVGHQLLGGLALGLARVHVHRGERLGGVDDQAAAAGQGHAGAGDVLELPLQTVVGEQRHLAGVVLDPLLAAAHVALEEVDDGGVHAGVVADDLIDVVGEVVAHRADDDVGLLVDQTQIAGARRLVLDVTPDAHQLLVVLLELGLTAALTGGAHDDAHLGGRPELVDDRLELFARALVADLAADAAAGGEGHQHQVAAGQRDLSGEGRALVAHLFAVGLDQQLGAHIEHVLDLGLLALGLGLARLAAVVARQDVAEGHEAVAVGAVVDEGRLQARLHGDHARLVDVAANLLVAGDVDVEVFENAVLDDRHTHFTFVRGVDQHLLAHGKPSKNGGGPCWPAHPEPHARARAASDGTLTVSRPARRKAAPERRIEERRRAKTARRRCECGGWPKSSLRMEPSSAVRPSSGKSRAPTAADAKASSRLGNAGIVVGGCAARGAANAKQAPRSTRRGLRATRDRGVQDGSDRGMRPDGDCSGWESQATCGRDARAASRGSRRATVTDKNLVAPAAPPWSGNRGHGRPGLFGLRSGRSRRLATTEVLMPRRVYHKLSAQRHLLVQRVAARGRVDGPLASAQIAGGFEVGLPVEVAQDVVLPLAQPQISMPLHAPRVAQEELRGDAGELVFEPVGAAQRPRIVAKVERRHVVGIGIERGQLAHRRLERRALGENAGRTHPVGPGRGVAHAPSAVEDPSRERGQPQRRPLRPDGAGRDRRCALGACGRCNLGAERSGGLGVHRCGRGGLIVCGGGGGRRSLGRRGRRGIGERMGGSVAHREGLTARRRPWRVRLRG